VYFKLVLDLDIPLTFAERIRKLRPQAAETVFWRQVRKHAERSENIAVDLYKIHQFVRKSFADNLHYEVTERLKAHLDPDAPEVARAIDALELQITEMRGGSLEIHIFALGFAKLGSVAGITADEFAKFLQVSTPAAMTAVFGVSGLVSAKATALPSAYDDAPSESSPATYAPAAPQASRHFPRLAFMALLAGAALWTFNGTAGGPAEERKAFASYAQEEVGRLGQERVKIASAHESSSSAERAAALAGSKAAEDKQNGSAVDPRDKEIADLNARPEVSVVPSENSCLVDANLIRRVQFALQQQQLYLGYIDGMFGTVTQAGLSNFQQRASLPVTGQIDMITLDRLGIRCGSA
jgi:hypothetical protein